MTTNSDDGAAPADDGTRWLMGMFISAVGVGVLVLVLAILQSRWFGDKAAPFSPFLVVVPVVIAAVAFFWIVNRDDNIRPAAVGSSGPGSGKDIEADEPRRSVRIATSAPYGTMLAIAVCAVFLSAAALLVLNFAAQTSPTFDRFALSLPVVNSPLGNSSDAQQSTAPSVPDAVLVWWVKRGHDALPAGTLPTALGGLFIVAFGIWFPRITLPTASGGMTISEKLIAPVLGIALVGIGASQQADAAKADQDVALARQGLPAIVRLSPEQRQLNTTMSNETSNVYVVGRDTISPEALAYLKDETQKVTGDLDSEDTAVGKMKGTLSAIDTDLTAISVDLSHRVQSPVTADDVAAVKSRLSSLDGRIETLNAAAEPQLQELAVSRQRGCNLLGLEVTDFDPKIAAALLRAGQADSMHEAFINEPWYKHLFKSAPASGDLDRLEVNELQAERGTVDQQFKVLCDGSTSTTAVAMNR
jgi:hypothetical protein